MKTMKPLWLAGWAGVLAVAACSTARAQFPYELIQFDDELLATNAMPLDLFGTSVAVRGDLAVVGASEADPAGDSSGAAYVFARSGSGWAKLQTL